MECCASGAKDTAAFDSAFGAGALPHESTIEYEGVYFKYMFETGQELVKDFAPVFTVAHTKDPISDKLETYVCVGMNGCLDGDGLKRHGGRPALNLVLVVDISGSMGSGFDGDYGLVEMDGQNARNGSKLQVACDAIVHGLLPQLTPKDRISIIAFDEKAHVVQAMKPVTDIDMAALKSAVLALKTIGGTVLQAGIDEASKQIKSLPDWSDKGRDNRIFFMTDMCPNDRDNDGAYLFRNVHSLANERVYTTFVGIGVDFDSSLTKHIATITACNYLSVSSTKEFKKMMNEQFDYLTTVSCLDVKVALTGGSVNVERVFGSPGFEHPKGGVLCEMSSSYPSMKESPTLTQGGVLLIKLAEPLPAGPLQFKVSYTGRKSGAQSDTYSLVIPPADKELFQGSAVRKAVLLTRYACLMKNYLIDAANSADKPKPTISAATGIRVPPVSTATKNYGRKTCKPLDDAYKAIFTKFIAHFEREAEELRDKALLKEVEVLQKVLNLA